MSSPPADNSSSSFDNLSSSLSAPPPPSSLNSPPPSSSNSSVLPPPPPLLSPPPPSTSKSSPPPSKLDNDDESSSPPLPSPPPPPPHPHKFSSSHPKELNLPSHHDGESNRSQDHSYRDHQFDVNLPVLTGIVAGVGLFFVLMIIICICCSKKKKRRNPMHYYTEGSTYNDSGGFYSRRLPQNWRDENKVVDYAVKVPLPPPPSTMMSTSDANSSYSGPHGPSLPPPSPAIALGFNKSTFSYEELAAATNGFSDANLLGQGGFGYVYKGVLPNGKEIAVKQLKSECGQGEREFQAEVEIISRVHHRHLVSLVGYCSAGSQRLLVYEFVPNNTLEYHLYGKGLPVVMNWSTRLRIALGSAKGLAYLHEDCHPRIIHRDIKAANILLDFKFEAMVADFGLAKLSSDNHTHVSTRVMGTLGYLAPEYASSGKLTEKSDVFSFGVMLLELITGRRPVDSSQFVEDSLVDWARPILSRALADGNYDELADPRLDGKFHPMEMARMVAAAAASVRHSAKRRPRMSQIVRALEGDVSLEDLNDGVRPGQWAEHALQLRS